MSSIWTRGVDNSVGGTNGNAPLSEEEVLIAQIKGFQNTFHNVVHRCHKLCIHDQRESSLSTGELSCTDRCASKYLDVHQKGLLSPKFVAFFHSKCHFYEQEPNSWGLHCSLAMARPIFNSYPLEAIRLLSRTNRPNSPSLLFTKHFSTKISPKLIYKMSIPELRHSIRESASHNLKHQTIWDAYMYAMALHRSQLSAADLAIMLYALATIGLKKPDFMNFILERVPEIAHTFTLRDIALLNTALVKSSCANQNFIDSVYSILLKRITVDSPERELALLSVSCCHIPIAKRDVLFSRISASLASRMDNMANSKSLSLLIWAFSVPYCTWKDNFSESFHSRTANALRKASLWTNPLTIANPTLDGSILSSFTDERGEAMIPHENGNNRDKVDVTVANALRHQPFVEALLDACYKHLDAFSGVDLQCVFVALCNLSVLKNALVSSFLLDRLQFCLEKKMFEFKNKQLMDILEGFKYFENLRDTFKAVVYNELEYRNTQFTAEDCLQTYKLGCREWNTKNVQLQSILCWRITDEVARTKWSKSHILKILNELTAYLMPYKLQGLRECILTTLQPLKPVDMDAKFAADISWNMSKVGIRPWNWPSLCSSIGYGFSGVNAKYLSKMLYAMARLRYPDIVDRLQLFPLAATIQYTEIIEALLVILSGVLFDLTERPKSLLNEFIFPAIEFIMENRSRLQPIEAAALLFVLNTSILEGCPSDIKNFFESIPAHKNLLPSHSLRFSSYDLQMCIDSMNHQSTLRNLQEMLPFRREAVSLLSSDLCFKHLYAANPSQSWPSVPPEIFSNNSRHFDTFYDRVLTELQNWKLVKIVRSHEANGLNIPFAIDVVTVGEHLKTFPLSQIGQRECSTDTISEPENDVTAVAEAYHLDATANETCMMHTLEPHLSLETFHVKTDFVEPGTQLDSRDDVVGEIRATELSAVHPPHVKQTFEKLGRRSKKVSLSNNYVSSAQTSSGIFPEDGTTESRKGDTEAVSASSYVLIDLLWKDFDYLYTSNVNTPRKACGTKFFLTAEKAAELAVMKRQGWQAICIDEGDWIECEKKESLLNEWFHKKRYIMKLLADIA